MTWSLIARDKDGAIGLIVASKFSASEAVVPYVEAKVAVASQAFCNPVWELKDAHAFLRAKVQILLSPTSPRAIRGPQSGKRI